MSQLKIIPMAIVGLAAIVVIGLLYNRHRSELTAAPSVQAKSQSASAEITYLPLGDSYTIGQSVDAADRWPNQLVVRLRAQGKILRIVANPAVTGYTTRDLIHTELPLVVKLKPSFVTLAIGVNDYVQGVDAATFSKNMDYILTSLQKQLPQPDNIVLLTIPDYGATPTGAEYGDPATSKAGIQNFNAILKQKAVQYRVPIADIFPTSEQVSTDSTLIASDGLHPSGKQYAAWTEIVMNSIIQNGLLGVRP